MARKSQQKQIDRELEEFAEEVHYAWTATSYPELQQVAYDVCTHRIGWPEIEERMVKRPALIVAAMLAVEHPLLFEPAGASNRCIANNYLHALIIILQASIRGEVVHIPVCVQPAKACVQPVSCTQVEPEDVHA